MRQRQNDIIHTQILTQPLLNSENNPNNELTLSYDGDSSDTNNSNDLMLSLTNNNDNNMSDMSHHSHIERITKDQTEYEGLKDTVEKLPNIFKYKNKPEASAYLLFAVGQGIIAGCAVYFSEGILILADDVAGCTDDDDECEEKVWGLLKPTSMISTIASIVALGGSVSNDGLS